MSDSADTPSLLPSVREPRVAEEPFNDRGADVVLRTSDKVDFYVYKNILSLASPFFKDMFSLPQPKPTSDSSIGDSHTVSPPVIDVSEDSRTLNLVLHFCYPVCRPPMTQLTDVGPVLLAAFKYDMNVVLAVAKIALEQCLEQDVLGAFALAFRCELYDVCSKAAGHFVQHPFLSLNSKELEFIKADKYRQLLNYQQRYTQDNNSRMPSWSDGPFKRLFGSPVLKGLSASGYASLPSIPATLTLPRDAVAPFDDKAADIVLRSSDPIDFHVHGFILSFVSPVFKDMILNRQKAQRASTCDGERPTIINVPEDSRTLDFVLRRCYPIRLPRLENLNEARRVLAAGVKYGIDGVKAFAEDALIEIVDRDIIGVWSTAIRYRLRDVCVAAARRSLQYPQASLESTELRYVSASQYHDLLLYHKRCGEAASAVVSSRAWFRKDMSLSDVPSLTQLCHRCCVRDSSDNAEWYASSSFWTFLEAAKGELEARPCGSTVSSNKLMGDWKPSYCPYSCGRQLGRDTKFAQAFANEVDRVITNVEVPNFF